jgi:hypothetical protein
VVVRDEALSGLRVMAQPGSTIRGRIVQEGTATPLPASRLQTVVSVAFEPAWRLAFGARLAARVSPAMEFVTHGLPPGEYFVVLPNQFAPAATGWFFESATRYGRDLLMEPLVLEAGTDIDDVTITFSDRRTMMNGRVTDASGQPTATAGVVMFPIDVDAWIARGLPSLASWAETASSSGTFAFDARPGEFLIAAIDEARLADWRRAEVVKALAVRATRVTLARGETGRVDLRVVAVPVTGGR